MTCNHCEAREMQALLRSLFTWTSDREVFGVDEYWTSFADDVRDGKPFKGDCDDYALTAAELLAEAGVPKNDMRLSFCYTETNEGHLNLLVETKRGTVAIDNRHRRALLKSSLKGYRWISFRRYGRGQKWETFK